MIGMLPKRMVLGIVDDRQINILLSLGDELKQREPAI